MRMNKCLVLLCAFVFTGTLMTMSPDADARAGFGGGSKSFSSRASSPSKGWGSSRNATLSKPSRSWGSSSAPSRDSTFVPPPKKTYDSPAAQAKRAEQSKERFTETQERHRMSTTTPKTASTGATVVQKPGDTTKSYWKDNARQLRQENRSLREDRERQIYGNYTSRQPVFSNSYNDVFGSPFFWMWLMSQQSHQRDEWLYHHKQELDPGRLAELQAKDAGLEARLKALEAGGKVRDPNYTPPELKGNEDLMYSEEGVEKIQAMANVEETKAVSIDPTESTALTTADHDEESSSFWLWVGALLVLGALCYVALTSKLITVRS